MSKKRIRCLLLSILLLFAGSALAEDGILTAEQLSGKRIGVQTGTVSGDVAERVLQDISVQFFNSQTDVLTALRSKKIDAWCTDEPILRFVAIEAPDLLVLDERLDISELAAVFQKSEKGQALRDQYSAFVDRLWEDGTMRDEIDSVWFGTDEEKRTVLDYESLPDPNGTLRLAVDPSVPPFSMMKENRVVGYDVDIAARFCQANGYRLEVVPMVFDGVLSSVQTGKVDFAVCGITVTEERAESVLFSSPTYHSGTALGVLRSGAAAQEEETSFWAGIAASFTRTFIREDRWSLFLDGVLTTLLITVLSILFGTALGFLVFLLCRNGNPAANAVTKFCIWLVQGMPMVVLLMILYYIVFGSMAVSGIAVAVLGFTLTFGAAVFGLMKMGVGTIDRGQYEAAYALGYSSRRTFFQVILPQAVPHVLPAYRGEIVSLIKATAIVGYIAVQDLTKVGDIVRSRTYEAFFPLIAVSVIYFLLEGLLGFLVKKIQIGTNPRKRKPEKILKGVEIHD